MLRFLAPTLAALACLTSTNATCANDRPAKPNIVMILTDDLGWQDVKCYDIDDPSPMETPNIDALATKGVMFWQAYSPAPTCAPTRCAIMSGIHPARAQKTHVVGGAPPVPHHRTKWRMMWPWYSGRMPDDEMTLAKVLQQNGYTTGHSGKWHMAISHKAFPQPEDQGFGWTRSNTGATRRMNPDRMSDFATNDAEDPFRLDENGFPFHQNSEDALSFLKEQQDKPFFLYYATWLVHAPIHTRSKPLLDKYIEKLGVEIPQDVSKWNQKGQTNPFYCAMVEQLDYYIGKLINHLETTEDPRWPGHMLSENTYLIFTSDNGGMEGSPGDIYTDNYPLDRGKISIMEGGTRVPLIITGPGIKQGLQSNVVVNGLDFYPTILSLVGAQKPAGKHFDGCDLSKLLLENPSDGSLVKDNQGNARDTMVWHFPNSRALESSIRIGDYKLIRNYDHVSNPGTDELELYQLYDSSTGQSKRVDIEEKNSLASTMPQKASQMNQKLTEILTEMKASYPYYNPHASQALPNKEKICEVISCKLSGNTVQLQYKLNGAKLERANLLYTLNGGHRYEEWFRTEAKVLSDSTVVVDLPAQTTHYFVNLIDENNFLVSHPEVSGDDNEPVSPYSQAALAVDSPQMQDKSNSNRESPYPGPAKLAARMDKDNNGSITRKEYLEARSNDFKRKDKNSDQSLQPEEHPHPSFENADADKDNLLTREEYLSIFERQFDRLDTNADGKIAVAKSTQ